MKKNVKTSLQKGFTLIEMLVVAPVVILTIGAFLTVIISMTGEVLSSRASTALAYNIQDALNQIETDVKLSTTYLATNNIELTASEQQGYNNDGTSFSNVGYTNGTSLILNMLVTDGNPIATTSQVVFLTNKPNGCSSNKVFTNTPMTMNVVYFIKNDSNNVSSLWRRTIMPSNYADGASVSCTAPWQRPSCAPNYTSSFCKTNDEKLVEGVSPSDFVVQYFSSAAGTTPNTIASNPASIPSVRDPVLQTLPTVNVSITAQQTVAGRVISRSASLRATRLDTNASTIAANIVTTPSAPSAVTATFTTPGEIAVAWQPNATSYKVQYDTSSSFSAPQEVTGTTASQTITGLKAASLYYFRVQSTNSAGTSGWSSTATAYSTITSGLMSWYPMNGNGNDVIGSNNATVVSATATTNKDGVASQAYQFNGTSAYLSLGSGFVNLASGVTVSIWANPTSTGSNAKFFNLTSGSGTGGIVFGRSTTTSSLAFQGSNSTIVTAAGITNSTWRHYVASENAAGAVRIYRDGVLLSTGTTGVLTNTSRSVNYIGRSYSSSDAYYAGSLDDARIYNSVLSDAEILSLFNDGPR